MSNKKTNLTTAIKTMPTVTINKKPVKKLAANKSHIKPNKISTEKILEKPIIILEKNIKKLPDSTVKIYNKKNHQEVKTAAKNSLNDFANILAQSTEGLTNAYFSFTQNNLDLTVKATKAMLAVKAFDEAVKLQADIFHTNTESFIAESTKLFETSQQITSDMAALLTSPIDE